MTEESQAMNERQKSDTLPDFLQPFAGDSTIHINYAYGIPFIIDDSVPMLLPPIDKEPKGYVSSQAFRKSIGILYVRYASSEKLSVCGVTCPLDSLLWLNKCLNDLYNYISVENGVEPNHSYVYKLRIITVNGHQLFEMNVMQIPKTEYWHKDYHRRLQSNICYYIDCQGNVLGKMNVVMPMRMNELPVDKPVPLRSSIPNYATYKKMFFKDTADKITLMTDYLIILQYIYIYSGSDRIH